MEQHEKHYYSTELLGILSVSSTVFIVYFFTIIAQTVKETTSKMTKSVNYIEFIPTLSENY